jgi:uncharacterized YccA/Bax inhibitor family protein
MAEQSIEITTLVVGIVVMACRCKWITLMDGIRDKVFILLKGVLALYLIDIFLLMVFDIPFPALHESSPAGIAVSIFIILIVVLNLACEYSGIRLTAIAGNNEQRGLDYILGFGVTLLWFFVEITGIMLKIAP